MIASLSLIVALVAALTLGGTSVAGDFGELITPDQAAEELEATDPAAVGTGTEGDAAVQATTSGFEATGTKNGVDIPADAAQPLEIETQSGTLEIDALHVSPAATDGEAVNDDNAVVYANTGTDSDTSVVPTQGGVETFTNIRSEAASEDFSVKVALPGDEQLQQIDDHTVAIVDPTPEKPSDQQLPDAAQPGTPEAARAREMSGMTDAKDPDPAAAAEARAGVEQAGTTKPDVPEDKLQQDARPDDATAAGLSGQPPAGQPEGEPADTSAIVQSALEDVQAEAEARAEHLAAAALEQATSTSQSLVDAANVNNAAESHESSVVVAKVTAPRSVDADGNPVETTLEAEGDVITMHVDHRNEDVAYPIAADPSYEVVYTRWTLSWYAELRPESYIHHWAIGSSYIGNWHVAYCWHIMYCAPTGGGWHNVIYGSNGYVAYWPRWDWGPAWLQFYYPVYATRMVVARWVPYWTPDPYSAAWVPVYADGEEVYDGGDPDNGDPDAVAAAVRPACKRVRWTNRVVGYGGGHLFYRFCWNRSKVKVSLDSQYPNRVESWVSFLGHVLGLTSIRTTGERFLPETLTYHGHWRGALDGHAQFKFRGEFGVGPASIGKDLMTVDWGVVARYDGSTCPYQKRERGATCGV